jgi:hypothetical protein
MAARALGRRTHAARCVRLMAAAAAARELPMGGRRLRRVAVAARGLRSLPAVMRGVARGALGMSSGRVARLFGVTLRTARIGGQWGAGVRLVAALALCVSLPHMDGRMAAGALRRGSLRGVRMSFVTLRTLCVTRVCRDSS